MTKRESGGNGSEKIGPVEREKIALHHYAQGGVTRSEHQSEEENEGSATSGQRGGRIRKLLS